MQIKNIQIFSSTNAADGSWVDVSNLVQLSVMLTGVEANVWIEVSDDPNAPIDGAGIGAPGSAPTLSQFASMPQADSGVNVSPTPPGDVSMLPATTFFVKTTFITKWGETTASAESSLAVTAGNYLYVAAPVPSAAQAPYVTGYNVYVGLVTNTEVLQTGPQYQPQRLVDGIGTVGGTVNPLGPGQSTHFAINGAIPINVPGFAMTNGFQQTQWVPPVSDQSGSASVGVNVSGNLPGSPATGSQIQITGASQVWMLNPSGLVWKWLRVRKDTVVGTHVTVAYLMGQNG
jgi:hypothetical protein